MHLVSLALISLAFVQVIFAQQNQYAKMVLYERSSLLNPFLPELMARQSGCDAGYSPCSDGLTCCPTGDACVTGGCCAPGDSPCPDLSGCCPTGVACIAGGLCNTTCTAVSTPCGPDSCCEPGYTCVYPATPACQEGTTTNPTTTPTVEETTTTPAPVESSVAAVASTVASATPPTSAVVPVISTPSVNDCTTQATALDNLLEGDTGCNSNPTASNCLSFTCAQPVIDAYYNLESCEVGSDANEGVQALITLCNDAGHSGLTLPTGTTPAGETATSSSESSSSSTSAPAAKSSANSIADRGIIMTALVSLFFVVML